MHTKIKSFLDASSASGDAPIADSNRFLPRKMPQSSNLSDLQLIRAASSLMVELENGKLSSTIRNFCKRAALESSEKYVYQIRKSGGEDSSSSHRKGPPQWGKWLQGDHYKETSQKLSKELQVANQICNIEKGVSGEVGRLRELGVYPTAELALIRRQFKLLEREWENGAGSPSPENSNDTDDHPRQEAELELEFVERKRQLLRHRRMEVESDLVLVGGATAREAQAQQNRMFFEPSRVAPPSDSGHRHRSGSNPTNSTSRKEASADAVLRHHPAHAHKSQASTHQDVSPYLKQSADTTGREQIRNPNRKRFLS
mmetsp:Transcript_15241/g.31070  ORF Transcript_15241/g.31070 Transcript_15241/m.31070 type:complete len:314 (-) Transcript_15241:8-949(-)